MSDNVIKGMATFSNHGTDQGIMPRFYLQMADLVDYVPDREFRRERLDDFLFTVIPDFNRFHDLFEEIKSIYIDYRDGLTSGKYYTVDNNSTFRHSRELEIALKDKVKDFFIVGRLVVFNFGKLGVVDEGEFVCNKLFIVKDSVFTANRQACLNSPNGQKYFKLLDIIEKARGSFLSNFNQIRADFEHQVLQVPDFKVKSENGVIEVVEPIFRGSNLLSLVENFYSQIFDFIEQLMAFYYGINAYIKFNGKMTLFENPDFNYSELRYRYLISFNTVETGLNKLLD